MGKGKSPRKKGKKGKGKKGKGKKHKPNQPGRREYQSRVDELCAQLDAVKAKCGQLEMEHQASSGKFEQERDDKEDIAAYLQLQNTCQEVQIEELTDDIAFLQSDADKKQSLEDADYDDLEKRARTFINELSGQCASLDSEIAKLDDFQERKTQLERGTSQVLGELTRKRLKYSSDIYFLERRLVETNHALKLEMKKRVRCVAAEYRKVSNSQLKETTKNAIMENRGASEHLVDLTEQTRDLEADNENLRKLVADGARRIEIMEELREQVTNKQKRADKDIHFLADRAQYLHTDAVIGAHEMDSVVERGHAVFEQLESTCGIEDEYQALLTKYRNLQVDEKGILTKLKDASSEATSLQATIDKCTLDLADHQADAENRTSAMPHILPLLTAASSGTVKRAVQQKLGPNQNFTYQRGNLGLVSNE